MVMELMSENLIIRNSTFNDCKTFEVWEKKDYVKEFLAIDDSRDYEEIVREFILREDDFTNMQFTIVFKKVLIPIGRIYISHYDECLKSLDITRIYIGEEEYIGKGYGKEAMKIILRYAFVNLEMERVTLDTFDGNKRADNLYKELGFVDEGCARNSIKKNGKYYNLNLKSMLRDEYFSRYIR
ncbi:MAG: N-acetyltransferase [Tissierellaceae bacterium]|nr:N-acetyltransferase [Tissierellaceae bacterium]